MPWRRVQVALRDQVLQQIDEGSTGICTGVQMDHIVGTTELKERLGLQNKEDDDSGDTRGKIVREMRELLSKMLTKCVMVQK